MTDLGPTEVHRKPFLLPADVLVFPVEELAEHVRRQLEYEEGDYAITRPGMRTLSQIVDRDTALLLEEFRKPSRLADAIVRYSRQNGYDPSEIVEKALPVLAAFSQAHFLVPADSPLAVGVSASFAPGQIVAGYEIKRLIHVLEDTELYQAYREDCGMVALKITRPAAASETIRMIEHEAAILQHLHETCFPRLVERGFFRERSFLTTSWLPGIPISRRAHELRIDHTWSGRQQLHRLCLRLIKAYAALHGQGVIHADVHPNNILVDASDRVYLLDFGLSRRNNKGDLDPGTRAGLAWFLEPELVRLLLRKQLPPPATFKSDQYAVAALLYFLLCGEHYLPAGVETEALYRQILKAQPPPFTRHSVESWPEVEAVLARALAKSPRQRFASMRTFADALRMARPPRQAKNLAATKDIPSQSLWLKDILDKTAYHPRPYEELYAGISRGSVYFGAAGLVWFLYRAAQVREEPHLLAAADLWLQQLSSRIETPGSFELPEDIRGPIRLGSVYLHRGGVHFVHALVSHARGELTSTTRQTLAFMSCLEAEENDLAELLHGRSGALVGGSLLLDILHWSPRLEPRPLANQLKEKALEQWSTLQKLAAIGEMNSIPHLGAAHGWVGLLYAQLKIHRALRLPPPPAIQDRLDQLAMHAEPMGRGISWVGSIQHPGQTSEGPMYAPGWCSGSAGYVFLWTLAHDVFQDDRFLELAEKSAWHAWEHPDRSPNLCCGLTGRAFALLRFYRHSGKSEWLGRAQQLAKLAFDSLDIEFIWDDQTLSLYRGALGPALLAVELEQPERAVMPLFESEGWPSSAARNVDRSVR